MDKMANMDEMVSALADGQLRGDAFAQAVDAVSRDAQARATWHTYHLIGDVLRSPELAHASPSEEFLARLQGRLAQEPGFSAERPVVDTGLVLTARTDLSVEAANASSFRWKLVAGVASVAAVAAIGWGMVGSLTGKPEQAELAQARPQAPVVAVAENAPAVMIRDPRLDELLAAHRQAGGASALQMPSGFLRNATFEGPAR